MKEEGLKIRIEKNTHRKLSLIKADKGFKSLSQTIEKLITSYESKNIAINKED